jgi:hypothetical protein
LIRAGAHFLDNPLQRIKRDVDALILGMEVPRTAMV